MDPIAIGCEAEKLSVTESANPVSFAESKRAYRGISPFERKGEVSRSHSNPDTSWEIPGGLTKDEGLNY